MQRADLEWAPAVGCVCPTALPQLKSVKFSTSKEPPVSYFLVELVQKAESESCSSYGIRGQSAFLKISHVRSETPVRKKEASVNFEGLLGKQMGLLFRVRDGVFSSVQLTFIDQGSYFILLLRI